nr:M1 family aminopeptidase [Nocardioides panaciterrulae]
MLQSPRVVHWLAQRLGPYPFSTTGGLTTSLAPGFALENQTRPTYPVLAAGAIGTVVHELAHQWFGDDVSIAAWRDVWLNEGAATFMQVHWTETHGGEPARRWLERWYDANPAGASFWDLDIADPGPAHLFDRSVYERGAMTLEALRQRIGEDAFWTLLRTWLQQHAAGTGSTGQFQALAERVSGADLSGFFDAWLRATERPARTAANGLDTAAQARR